jgi:hypothetical protein
MKTFKIFKNETNLNWVNNNLDLKDYEVGETMIVIYYNHDFQKNDILNALKLYFVGDVYATL